MVWLKYTELRQKKKKKIIYKHKHNKQLQNVNATREDFPSVSFKNGKAAKTALISNKMEFQEKETQIKSGPFVQHFLVNTLIYRISFQNHEFIWELFKRIK